MSAALQVPVSQQERFVSLDVMRGVALFGILLMNIASFGLPFAYDDPTNYGGATGPDLWAWIVTTVGFEGTQRGLFSILFGAGSLLLISRIERRGGDASDVFFRRNLWLILFGIVHGFLLLWTGEILFFYGATAPFIFPFRKALPKTLLAFALGGLLVGAAWNLGDAMGALRTHRTFQEATRARAAGATLTRVQNKALKDWPGLVESAKPPREKIEERLEVKQQGSYARIVAYQAPLMTHAESWYQYRYFFDVWSMMLIGMALLKLRWLEVGRDRRPYLWMVLVGYGVGFTTNLLELRHVLAYDFHVLAMLQAAVTYDLGRLAMTMGHLGALMLWCNSGLLAWLQLRLAAVGQLALSNYLTHSIVCGLLFNGFGFGLYGRLPRHQLYYVVFAIWVVQLVISPIWLRHFRFGPAEWLWRTLTYGERQPMRRGAPAGDQDPLPAPAA
ncbi:hypothetical protein TBR22_A08650 [Luteitalea sp. TBR-22]|uniref:DUF418 domain-containing protein n=1 Tax=Luteitalea sp. TBR-22 TaxID=2802971 RepID=UPI001AF74E7F|nr:DUF418 domain-containing protein [Luteitalea sp. TBR-22]BCS31662.1 hypothetical protein TBR22_A08650 [Luteitalea sp. TBR-22]